MKVRDIILVVYGVALLAMLFDVAVRAKRETAFGTFYDDSTFSHQVWTRDI